MLGNVNTPLDSVIPVPIFEKEASSDLSQLEDIGKALPVKLVVNLHISAPVIPLVVAKVLQANLEVAIEPANISLVTDPVAGAIVSTALPKNTAYIVSELVIAEDRVSVVPDTV